jgi:hypothetical protein
VDFIFRAHPRLRRGPGYRCNLFAAARQKVFPLYPLREPKPRSGFGQAKWPGHVAFRGAMKFCAGAQNPHFLCCLDRSYEKDWETLFHLAEWVL